MKQLLLIIWSLTIMGFTQAQDVKAYLNFNKFYSPIDGPYIETYIAIDGNSVNWPKDAQSNYQAQVEATLMFMQDTTIVRYSKVLINSAPVSDSAGMKNQFMNIQRFVLPNGEYKVRIRLDDMNDTLDALFSEGIIHINFPNDSASISSIEVVRSYGKAGANDPYSHSGLSLIPNIFNYFSTRDTSFVFYAELYHVNKTLSPDEVFLVNYYLANEENQIIPQYRKVERHKAGDVEVIFNKFDISKLPTGNYFFKLELINKENKIIAQREYFFQRENFRIKLQEDDINNVQVINTFAEVITGKDTLADVIKAMRPVMSANEVDLGEDLMKKGDEKLMQQFIYTFWHKRNPDEPSKPFIAYMKEVMKVNNEFGTSIKKGYETDRGYVYLRYGEPNSINRQYNEPATYPYEIWHYYSARGQSNVRFVFYNPDLVTNDFQLLHSNAVGEVSNYQWRLALRKRDKGWNSIDQTGEETDEWGTHYNEYYNEPR